MTQILSNTNVREDCDKLCQYTLVLIRKSYKMNIVYALFYRHMYN